MKPHSRLVVFTGCVLDPDDPLHRGVQIPLRLFKVAAFLDDGYLGAPGYVLDQTPLEQDLPATLAASARAGIRRATGSVPHLPGPHHRYRHLTGLDLTALAAAYRTPVPTGARPDKADAEPGWCGLRAPSDIVRRRPQGSDTG